LPCSCALCRTRYSEFKYVTLIEIVDIIIGIASMLMSVDKALDVARGRVGYAKLLPNWREAVEVFVSVFVCIPAGYAKSFGHFLSY